MNTEASAERGALFTFYSTALFQQESELPLPPMSVFVGHSRHIHTDDARLCAGFILQIQGVKSEVFNQQQTLDQIRQCLFHLVHQNQ